MGCAQSEGNEASSKPAQSGTSGTTGGANTQSGDAAASSRSRKRQDEGRLQRLCKVNQQSKQAREEIVPSLSRDCLFSGLRYVPAERSRCCCTMDRLDVRGKPEHGCEHSCVIGKCKATPEQCQRSIAPSKDEVGKRREQDAAYSHRRCRIECAVVSRN